MWGLRPVRLNQVLKAIAGENRQMPAGCSLLFSLYQHLLQNLIVKAEHERSSSLSTLSQRNGLLWISMQNKKEHPAGHFKEKFSLSLTHTQKTIEGKRSWKVSLWFSWEQGRTHPAPTEGCAIHQWFTADRGHKAQPLHGRKETLRANTGRD